MRNRSISIAGVIVLAFVIAAFAAFAQTKPVKPVSVTGEVVDLWCFVDHGAHGATHKACGVACAQGGNPIGIVDSKGKIYLIMNSEKHGGSRDNLIEHMADTVTATGKVVSKGGLQVLYVDTIK